MFKVIIADDEPRLCELIKHLIRWDEMDLELVACVHDGLSLYNHIRQMHPDIVITDVLMPKMTGLEIIQKAEQENFGCSFIIISGYRDFDYVQNAVKYGACDYLLKPIDREELNSTLKKICGRLTDSLDQTRTMTGMHEEMEQNRRSLHRQLLLNAVRFGSETFADIALLNQEYSVAFGPGIYRAVCLTVEGGESGMPDSLVQQAAEMLKTALQVGGKYAVSCVQTGEAWFLINDADGQDGTEALLENAFAAILRLTGKFAGVQATLCCGNAVSVFSAFPQSIRQAKIAFRERICLGRGRIIRADHLPKESGYKLNISLTREQVQQLEHILDGLNSQKYEEWLWSVCAPSADWSGNAWYELCGQIGAVFDRVTQSSTPLCEHSSITEDMISDLERAPVGQFKQALLHSVAKHMQQLSEQRQEQSSKPVRLAKEYIQSHYMEAIRLEDVAAHVYLHPAYLSHLFKETLGIGFSDYLANCRLERAKELLTKTTETVYSIARQVGYTEARAFSKFFLKNVGVKPSEYRKMYS